MENNLYELSKNLYEQLMTNKSELNQVAFCNFLNNFSFIAKEKYEKLLNGSLDTMGLAHMLNIGSTINYDLLADFLLDLTYVKIPNGPYSKSKDEAKIVKNYDEFQKTKLLNTVSRFMFIHEMFKTFVMFVRRNYYSTFFSKLDLLHGEGDSHKNILDFYHVVYLVLRPGKLVFSCNLKNQSQVFEYIEGEQLKKADLVSRIVDTNNYKEIVTNQYKLMIKEIDLYLEFIKYNKPQRKASDVECEVFKNFAISLKEYMYERIEFLNNPLKKTK